MMRSSAILRKCWKSFPNISLIYCPCQYPIYCQYVAHRLDFCAGLHRPVKNTRDYNQKLLEILYLSRLKVCYQRSFIKVKNRKFDFRLPYYVYKFIDTTCAHCSSLQYQMYSVDLNDKNILRPKFIENYNKADTDRLYNVLF